MITSLEKIDSFVPNEVHDAMLLSQATRPKAGAEMLQGLGFSDTLVWVAQDLFDDMQAAESGLAVVLDPEL